MKRQMKLKSQHGALKPGVYWFADRLGTYLLSVGKAEVISKPVVNPVIKKTYIPIVKQEKRVIETKEEKFEPETKVPIEEYGEGYTAVPISKLDVGSMTDEELQSIVDNDDRVTAVKMAKKELDNR
jgi:hypothetical protein